MHTAKSIIIITLFISILVVAQKRNNSNSKKYSGRVVIFFGPSQAEYDSLAKDESSGINEIVGDFNYYANKLDSSLKSKKIKPIMTSARSIVVLHSGKSLIINRIQSESPIGVIMSDGVQQPKVFYNVMTDDELWKEVVSFYKIK